MPKRHIPMAANFVLDIRGAINDSGLDGNTEINGQISIIELEGAQLAFQAYKQSVAGIAYDGKPIPDWHDITEKARGGWLDAFRAAALFAIARYPSEPWGDACQDCLTGNCLSPKESNRL